MKPKHPKYQIIKLNCSSNTYSVVGHAPTRTRARLLLSDFYYTLCDHYATKSVTLTIDNLRVLLKNEILYHFLIIKN